MKLGRTPRDLQVARPLCVPLLIVYRKSFSLLILLKFQREAQELILEKEGNVEAKYKVKAVRQEK